MVVDAALPQEICPLPLSGICGKPSWKAEQVAADLRLKLGKGEIVTAGQADLDAERGLDGRRGRVARRDLLGLAIARAVGDVDVEQVQLAVRRDDLPSRRDQRRGVVDPAAFGAPAPGSLRELRDRSGQP